MTILENQLDKYTPAQMT